MHVYVDCGSELILKSTAENSANKTFHPPAHPTHEKKNLPVISPFVRKASYVHLKFFIDYVFSKYKPDHFRTSWSSKIPVINRPQW